MSNADFDNNGFIDYNEFVSATADWKKLMSQEKLKKALEDFKSSGGGRLNLEEFT
jgi:Ca2+-binding EF-hand superfamily protein